MSESVIEKQAAAAYPAPAVEELSMQKAINRALADALRADPKVLVLGEDVGQLGGVFRVTADLQAEFGVSEEGAVPPHAVKPDAMAARRIRVYACFRFIMVPPVILG